MRISGSLTFDLQFGRDIGCPDKVAGLARVRCRVLGNNLLDYQSMFRFFLLHNDPIRRNQLRIALKPVQTQ